VEPEARGEATVQATDMLEGATEFLYLHVTYRLRPLYSGLDRCSEAVWLLDRLVRCRDQGPTPA
jgi:hypothetical protein